MGLHHLAFATVFLLYGIWGTPTPDAIGWLEITIGALLIFLCLPKLQDLKSIEHIKSDTGFWLAAAGMFSGLIMAGVAGNAPNAVTRDLLAFMFLLLPFWLSPYREDCIMRKLLISGSIFVGLSFSLRFLTSIDPLALANGTAFSDPHYSYLANSPLVLFTALYMLYKVFEALHHNAINIVRIAAYALAMAIPLLAMGVMQQRATLLCIAVYAVILSLWTLLTKPAKGVFILAIAATLSFSMWDALYELLIVLWEKTRLSGTNMRLMEWQAVLSQIDSNTLTALFGKGWGSAFFSPAVGNVPVTFTHSLLSMYLLKIGIFGTALLCAYFTSLLYQAKTNIAQSPFLFLTLLFPFLIGIFLYANFKSLGFGIILLMLCYGINKGSEKEQLYPVH